MMVMILRQRARTLTLSEWEMGIRRYARSGSLQFSTQNIRAPLKGTQMTEEKSTLLQVFPGPTVSIHCPGNLADGTVFIWTGNRNRSPVPAITFDLLPVNIHGKPDTEVRDRA